MNDTMFMKFLGSGFIGFTGIFLKLTVITHMSHARKTAASITIAANDTKWSPQCSPADVPAMMIRQHIMVSHATRLYLLSMIFEKFPAIYLILSDLSDKCTKYR